MSGFISSLPRDMTCVYNKVWAAIILQASFVRLIQTQNSKIVSEPILNMLLELLYCPPFMPIESEHDGCVENSTFIVVRS